MKRLLIGVAALCLSAGAAFANGYPSGGKAIDCAKVVATEVDTRLVVVPTRNKKTQPMRRPAA